MNHKTHNKSQNSLEVHSEMHCKKKCKLLSVTFSFYAILGDGVLARYHDDPNITPLTHTDSASKTAPTYHLANVDDWPTREEELGMVSSEFPATLSKFEVRSTTFAKYYL